MAVCNICRCVGGGVREYVCVYLCELFFVRPAAIQPVQWALFEFTHLIYIGTVLRNARA